MGLALLLVLTAACTQATGLQAEMQVGSTATTTSTSSTSTSTTTTTPTSVPPSVLRAVQAAADAPAPASPAAPAASPPATRSVHQQAWTPFASAGGVVLRHPSSRVEVIGFHESNLDGARLLEPLPTSAPTISLEGRGRDTGSRTAADVVVDPATEIRAPVTGTVRYADSYVLYCRFTDNFVIIEPDDHPGWEVKLLHIDGLLIGVGARVTAGQTPISPHARKLPFESQVDGVSAQPSWPHVHIEIDDPNIPDRPTPGGGC